VFAEAIRKPFRFAIRRRLAMQILHLLCLRKFAQMVSPIFTLQWLILQIITTNGLFLMQFK
jgi:hypothetical protein